MNLPDGELNPTHRGESMRTYLEGHETVKLWFTNNMGRKDHLLRRRHEPQPRRTKNDILLQ